MNLTDTQKVDISKIIEKAKILECSKANSVIENAVNEWKKGKKTDIEAYNKIYKKVIKNEHHLVFRYTKLDNDEKIIRTLAEIFADDIIDMSDFDSLDKNVKQEVFRLIGIN